MSNINKIKGKTTKVTFGGKTHTIKFDMNSFAALEEFYGDIDEIMGKAEKGTVKGLRAMIWAGIIHEYLDEEGEPTIKPHEVGAMISAEDLPEIFKQVNDVMRESMPEEAKELEAEIKAKEQTQDKDPLEK
jgi:hypothetical protein